MKCGIYSIRSKNANFIYIGGSRDIDVRWKTHITELRAFTHHCLKLLSLYMVDRDLEFSILELCDVKALKARENFWISQQDERLLLNTNMRSSFSRNDPAREEERLLKKIEKQKELEIKNEKKDPKFFASVQDVFDVIDIFKEGIECPHFETLPVSGKHLKHLITVVDSKKMNEQPHLYKNEQKRPPMYTKSFFAKADDEQLLRVKLNLTNFFKNMCTSLSSNNLWTTFKSIRLIGSHKEIRDTIIGNPYKVVGRLRFEYDMSHTNDPLLTYDIEKEKARMVWLPHTTRNTNLYTDRSALAYVMVPHLSKEILDAYLRLTGEVLNKEKYDLGVMLRFIFLSAIRKGEPINIYVPSCYMRHLLLTWLGYTQEELF